LVWLLVQLGRRPLTATTAAAASDCDRVTRGTFTAKREFV
jgi:hypothetical protein